MNTNYRIGLFLVLLVLDAIIIYLWTSDSHTWGIWERNFCTFSLVTHSLLYIALYYEDRKWLDILHVAVVISVLYGFIIQNIPLLTIMLCFCVGVQIQWVCMNICVLNSDAQNANTRYGVNKLIVIFTLLYTCYLSFKLGRLGQTVIESVADKELHHSIPPKNI